VAGPREAAFGEIGQTFDQERVDRSVRDRELLVAQRAGAEKSGLHVTLGPDQQ
jgi:hypothetical protein